MNSFQKTHYKSNLFKAIIFAFILFMFGSGLTSIFVSQNVASAQETSQSSTVAYLHKDWKTKIATANENITGKVIKSVTFTDTLPTGTALCSVGSTMETDGVTCGVSDYTATDGVSDVLAYVSTDTVDTTLYNIVLYAPCTIYAPTDSTELFSIYYTESQTSGNSTSVIVRSNLTTIDFNSKQFNTSKVTNMYAMFALTASLQSLDLSEFNTSNVTDMSGMFLRTTNLQSLDLSEFNTSNVTNMANMFYKSSSLTSLDLSNFNTSKVANMYAMFADCTNLTNLNISNFDLSQVYIYANTDAMFNNCGCSPVDQLTFYIAYSTRSYAGVRVIESVPFKLSNNEQTFDLKAEFKQKQYILNNVAIHENDSSILPTTVRLENSILTIPAGFYGNIGIEADLKGVKNNITYDTNGGSSVASGSYNTYWEPINISISGDIPTRPGYTFVGWEITQNTINGECEIIETYGVTDEILIPENAYGDIKLTAVWELVDYTITICENGGSEVSDLKYNISDEEQIVNLPLPVKNGYLLSWSFSNNTLGVTSNISNNVLTLPAGAYSDICIEAEWTIIDYTITFDENSNFTVEDLTYNISEEVQTKELQTLTRVGYTFVGWTIVDNTLGVTSNISNSILTIPAGAYGNIEIQAMWNLIDYKIVIDENGGNVVEDVVFNINEQAQTKTLPTLIRKGYTFTNWTIVADAVGEPSSVVDNTIEIFANSYGNIVLLANWSVNSYTITLELDGAEFEGETTCTLVYGEAYGELPKPTKEGYVFKGWYLDEAFTQKVTAETIVQIDGDHKLYAKWEKPEEKGFFETTEGMIVLGAGGVLLIGLGVGLIFVGRRKKTK